LQQRVTIDPSEENGLRVKSQVMADKPVTIRRERIGRHQDAALTGGIRGDETVAGEAGGLPLDTRTASRSAAPSNTLFHCGLSTNNHWIFPYIAAHFLDKTYANELEGAHASMRATFLHHRYPDECINAAGHHRQFCRLTRKVSSAPITAT
jgi:hypothetical protein